MNSEEYRESLRRYHPVIYVDGERVASIADDPRFAPGVRALGVSYDFALKPELAPVMLAQDRVTGRRVNRMLHINSDSGDLLNKLEAVRLLCQETGCAQRYLAHDALNALYQVSARLDAETRDKSHVERFRAYLDHVQEHDLSIGIAMTDAKGDRSRRPHEQGNADSYVHVVERNERGIVISGTKAIVTGGPYMHELLVMPCRNMTEADAQFAVCCATPVDAPGITMVSRPAGRPGEKAALFSAKYGQSTAVVMFDRVQIPWEKVFYAGDWQQSATLTYSYATHHRHSCIAARAGFGDLLIGAGAMMCEANGFDIDADVALKDQMVDLIKIVEGFYACGVAASVYAQSDPYSGSLMPDPVYSNIGKLLLSTQIYDMQRIAHTVSGGLIVALPGPDEDHNPHTAARLADVLRANPAIPYDKRIETARFIEDLTASYTGGWYSVISLHGGGSPAAMKQEIWRHYPVEDKVALVNRLLERGVTVAGESARQPGKCCAKGCSAPGETIMVDLPLPPAPIKRVA